ncbi:MAG TPA: hypothetical protein VMD74_03755 [Candidatus Methylomirabilis sp.]|nr:hypothetical protein [Candidatus Methylomirabilis sp.]
MPKNPSEAQKIKWHLEHIKHCACRTPSAKLLLEMKKMGFIAVKKSRKSLAKE